MICESSCFHENEEMYIYRSFLLAKIKGLCQVKLMIRRLELRFTIPPFFATLVQFDDVISQSYQACNTSMGCEFKQVTSNHTMHWMCTINDIPNLSKPFFATTFLISKFMSLCFSLGI